MRLDLYISQKLWVSRNRAQFFIDQEKIKVNWKIIKKVSYNVSDKDIVKENIQEINYVARSALKLKWFLENENVIVKDFICLDIWSSTWGFTQILLEKWVKKIYSIDVWDCQLHPTLKNNPKIVSIENTDIRDFKKDTIKEKLDLIVCDVSFISLNLIIDSIISLMDNETLALLLFKPQFEVWSENLTKHWVPKSDKKSQEKMSNFLLLLDKKWVKVSLIRDSSLTWEKWNRETFIFIHK